MTPKTNAAPSRRAFLKRGLQGLGGVAVLASGGLVWRAVAEDIFSPFDGPAYAPWQTWKSDATNGPMALVRMAILAANPHNTQPWRFHVTDNRIDLFADRQRHLGAFDSYRREMQIGLGCALENIAVSAPAHGLVTRIEMMDGQLTAKPETTGTELVARIHLTEAKHSQSELYRAIPHRHTDRSAYDRSRAIPDRLTAAMTAMAEKEGMALHLFEDGPERLAFDKIMMAATNAIVDDPAMVAVSHDWIRTSDRAVQEHRDGPTLDAVGLPPVITVLAKIFPDPDAKTGHEMWRDATRDKQLESTPVTGFLSVRNRYSKKDNLRAGRVWQRLHLLATTEGLSMQPMNQPVEMIDREDELNKPPLFRKAIAELIGGDSWQSTFSFRMGYREGKSPPSPRRPIEDRLI
jgi:nitroreductase